MNALPSLRPISPSTPVPGDFSRGSGRHYWRRGRAQGNRYGRRSKMSAVDSWMQTRTGPGCVVPCTLVRWCIGQGFYSGMLYQNAHRHEHETLVSHMLFSCSGEGCLYPAFYGVKTMLSAEHIKFHVFYAFPSCTQFEVETRHSSYEAVVSRKRESFGMHERVGVHEQLSHSDWRRW